MTRTIAALATAACLLAVPSVASAGGIFGTYPLKISVAPNGAPANGPSSAPAISGDNRKTRYVAFESDATNLVAGDNNGVTDIFVWSRPRGRAGLTLPPGAGSLQRASVASNGAEANGPSRNPSLDGSVKKAAHCVAFESDASNLAPGDTDNVTDVFVRDLRARKTFLVSRGIAVPATQPAIDGACKHVAFAAGGRILVAGVKSGRARAIGAGDNPDYSLDGRAITWQQGGQVMFMRDGHKSVVGPGENPTVSDAERLHGMKTPKWGVSFDTPIALSSSDHNPGVDTYMRVFGPRGGARSTVLISSAQPKVHFDGSGNNFNGGITAYGPTRGIVSFVHSEGLATDAYYWNGHTGHADDTAHAASRNGTPGISEMVTSARANFIAFSSSFTGSMAYPVGSARGTSVGGSVESLFDRNQNIWVKMLVDGEAL